MVADQTGSGKTLAYLAPLVQRLRFDRLFHSRPAVLRVACALSASRLQVAILNGENSSILASFSFGDVIPLKCNPLNAIVAHAGQMRCFDCCTIPTNEITVQSTDVDRSGISWSVLSTLWLVAWCAPYKWWL